MKCSLYQSKIAFQWPDKISRSKTGALINPAEKTTWEFKSTTVNNTNILGLVVFSTVLGVAIAITTSPEYSDSEYGSRPGLPVLRFFRSFTVIMMKVRGFILNTIFS